MVSALLLLDKSKEGRGPTALVPSLIYIRIVIFPFVQGSTFLRPNDKNLATTKEGDGLVMLLE